VVGGTPPGAPGPKTKPPGGGGGGGGVSVRGTIETERERDGVT
jgi:hypothetical protein